MFRIYTEDLDRAGIERIVSARFEGFTEISAIGFWQGQRENSLVIEISTSDADKVNEIAESIRVFNHQTSVMVTESAEATTFVEGRVAA